MAEVTVSELAKSVGASVERLLSQMKDAGLEHDSAEQVVSDTEKQTLLTFLKGSHGDDAAAPKKITLRRKTTSTLKMGSGSSRKTVNVEVRKKRTYIKRDPAELEEAVKEVAEVEAPVVEPIEAVSEPVVIDVELKRQAATKARREEEEAAKQKAEEKARKSVAEKESTTTTKTVEDKASKPRSDAPKAQDDEPKHGKRKDKHAAPVDEGELRHKKTKRAGAAGPKKAKRIDLLVEEVLNEEEDLKGDAAAAVAATTTTTTTTTTTSAPALTRTKRKKIKPAIKLVNKHKFKMPTQKIIHEVEIPPTIVVAELAQRMNVKAGELIKRLMKLGVMTTINEAIDQETAQLLVEELGHKAKLLSGNEVEENLEEIFSSDGEKVARAPVVTVMGHVDHGKTSLLDYIRNAKVASGEAGGITQHIGAYRVSTGHGEITFLDTPGHAAFTSMRARGAQCTDVVILVVAADDGVMPQTEEAVLHAKAAGVPMVVAINKCDKEAADPDRVKNELSAKDVIPEDWGGDTQFIQVSAHTGDGIDALLDAVLLQAEMQELTAVVDAPARGVVVESRVDAGRGVVATILVQQGTLKIGDILLAGQSYGRIKALNNEVGEQVQTAGPSTPVEVLGLDATPAAGDAFVVVPDEKKAREIALHRSEKEKQERLQRLQASKLENMFSSLEEGEKKILTIVLKTDVRGSLEAIQSALLEIGNDEVNVNIVTAGVGGITENDINLALTTGAIVIGFNVRTESSARKMAEQESIEVRYYSIIYQLLDDVKSALSGMLSPERVEEIIGIADVRDVFRSPKFGQVAGCMVVEGTVHRSKPIRVLRDNVVIYEGELDSLRRFKDDVAEVRNGIECGIGVKDYDVKVGDQIEVFQVTEVSREL